MAIPVENNSETEGVPKDFHVRVLDDGTIIYGCGMDDEVAYDTMEQLFQGMKPDLEAAQKDSGGKDSGLADRKKNVEKMMGDNSNEE